MLTFHLRLSNSEGDTDCNSLLKHSLLPLVTVVKSCFLSESSDDCDKGDKPDSTELGTFDETAKCGGSVSFKTFRDLTDANHIRTVNL